MYRAEVFQIECLGTLWFTNAAVVPTTFFESCIWSDENLQIISKGTLQLDKNLEDFKIMIY